MPNKILLRPFAYRMSPCVLPPAAAPAAHLRPLHCARRACRGPAQSLGSGSPYGSAAVRRVQDPQAALHLVSRLVATEAMDQPTFIRRRALHQARDAQGVPRSDAIREALARRRAAGRHGEQRRLLQNHQAAVFCAHTSKTGCSRLPPTLTTARFLAALVFDTPLTACRVMKHIAKHERFPSENEIADYGTMIANTSDDSIVADVKEGAHRRGVPTSDCLGAVVHSSGPSGGPSVAIA